MNTDLWHSAWIIIQKQHIAPRNLWMYLYVHELLPTMNIMLVQYGSGNISIYILPLYHFQMAFANNCNQIGAKLTLILLSQKRCMILFYVIWECICPAWNLGVKISYFTSWNCILWMKNTALIPNKPSLTKRYQIEKVCMLNTSFLHVHSSSAKMLLSFWQELEMCKQPQ